MKTLLKKVINPGHYPANISISLLFLRVVTGAFMLTHGYGKFLMLFSDGPIQFPDPIGVGATASLVLVVFAEFLCSILLIFGFMTRLSAIPLLTTMLVAALIFHAQDPFANRELALLYSAVFMVYIIAGAGRYSFDNWIYSKL